MNPTEHEIEQQLLALRPEVRMSAEYRERVRQEAMRKVRPAYSFTFLFMSKLTYAALGAVLTLAVALPSAYYAWEQPRLPNALPRLSELVSPEVKVEKVAANAFGKLEVNNAMGKGGAGNASVAAREQGQGMNATVNAVAMTPQVNVAATPLPARTTPEVAGAAALPVTSPVQEKIEVAADTSMPMAKTIAGGGGVAEPVDVPYRPTVVTYALPEGFTIPEEGTTTVLARVKEMALPATDMLMGGFGLFDGKAFQNTKMDTVSFKEDRPFGYQVFISFTEGTVSINAAWEKWPNEYEKCSKPMAAPDCGPKPLGEQDMLADSELVGIADAFLKEYGISVASFGAPVVDRAYRTYVTESVARGETPYYPDQLNVIYPLMVEGELVQGDGMSQPVGLQVSVSLRYKKVMGVWNLANQSYQASEYAGAPASMIARFAESGGNFYQPEGTEVRYLRVQLGTPKRVLTQQWLYDGVSGRELLVPSLVFPVLDRPVSSPENGYTWVPEMVTVPLARDILEARMPSEGAMPRPMPLGAAATSSAVAVPVRVPAAESGVKAETPKEEVAE